MRPPVQKLKLNQKFVFQHDNDAKHTSKSTRNSSKKETWSVLVKALFDYHKHYVGDFEMGSSFKETHKYLATKGILVVGVIKNVTD